MRTLHGRALLYGDNYHRRDRAARWLFRRLGWMLHEQPVTWVACWGGCTDEVRAAWPHRWEGA